MEEVKKESVLITGGAGYIGSYLTGYLLNKGYKVTCLDGLNFNQTSLFQYASNPDFDFIYGDSRNRELLEEVVPGFDVIIPLAAVVGMPASQIKTFDTSSTNYESIVAINQIRKRGQKLIFPTTNSGYGTSSGEMFCTEETPLEPISLYGITKVNAEKYLQETAKSEGKDVITLRLATVFGVSPRMRTDLLVNDFVLRAIRDGYIILYEKDFKRNFIHIHDVARCFEFCIQNFEDLKNEPYNVGLNEANLSKDELAKKIKEHLPNFSIYYNEIDSDPDKRNYIISNEKINKKGFQAEVSLDQGVKELKSLYKMLLKTNPHDNL